MEDVTYLNIDKKMIKGEQFLSGSALIHIHDGEVTRLSHALVTNRIYTLVAKARKTG